MNLLGEEVENEHVYRIVVLLVIATIWRFFGVDTMKGTFMPITSFALGMLILGEMLRRIVRLFVKEKEFIKGSPESKALEKKRNNDTLNIALGFGLVCLIISLLT